MMVVGKWAVSEDANSQEYQERDAGGDGQSDDLCIDDSDDANIGKWVSLAQI